MKSENNLNSGCYFLDSVRLPKTHIIFRPNGYKERAYKTSDLLRIVQCVVCSHSRI